MNPKTDLAILVMKQALREFGFSEKELFDATFHLTDWIEELKAFVTFLEHPERYDPDAVQTLLIALLIHAPPHLVKAAEIVLEEPAAPRTKNRAIKRKRQPK